LSSYPCKPSEYIDLLIEELKEFIDDVVSFRKKSGGKYFSPFLRKRIRVQ